AAGTIPAALRPLVSRYGPAAAGGVLEGLTEGTLAYEEARKTGKSVGESSLRAMGAGAATAASSAFFGQAMIRGVGGPGIKGVKEAAKRVGVGAAAGGVEETTQSITTPLALGEVPDLGELITSFVAGGFAGGGISTVGAGIEQYADRGVSGVPDVVRRMGQGPEAAAREQHYETLGLGLGATQEDIRRAYLEKAIKYHPDMNQGDTAAGEQFRSVLDAYEALKETPAKPEVSQQPEARPEPAAAPEVTRKAASAEPAKRPAPIRAKLHGLAEPPAQIEAEPAPAKPEAPADVQLPPEELASPAQPVEAR
ncbi:hypothetical protein LCGC14_2199040, partial [marine sediment metagenome]